MSMFQDISKFSNTNDYLPILIGATITDVLVMTGFQTGYIQAKSLHAWYHKYGLAGVLADVFSITIGIIIARFIYSYFFTTFSLIAFLAVTVGVQMTHDVCFAKLVQSIPRGRSQIIDTFKDYANELGATILFGDALMMISSVLLASIFAGYSHNIHLVSLIVAVYLIPYFLYSI